MPLNEYVFPKQSFYTIDFDNAEINEIFGFDIGNSLVIEQEGGFVTRGKYHIFSSKKEALKALKKDAKISIKHYKNSIKECKEEVARTIKDNEARISQYTNTIERYNKFLENLK